MVKKALKGKKKKPKFNVLNARGGKRAKRKVKTRWRKPRGVDNKKRIRKASHGASPRVGYKNPASIRGLHPSGLKEVLVNNPAELEAAKGHIARISGKVGKRKRAEIEKKAEELKIPLANRKGVETEKKKMKVPEKPKEVKVKPAAPPPEKEKVKA